MWFNYLVLLTALVISGVAEYYSIIGLTAIFAATFWPVVILGCALGAGKLVTTVWLKRHWHRASWYLKIYLTAAVLVLMLITSMGIFGFLSKGHLDQAIPSGDIADKIAVLDEKIRTQRENIDAARKALKQLDESVDQTMSRTTDDNGATRAANLRRSQQKERGQLQADIAQAQTQIAKLNEEKAPIAKEFRKVEAEVGPIKYVAALIYGDNPDANLLERAVRWVIIIIVFVFDPLAVALLLAANSSMQWERENKTASRNGVPTKDQDDAHAETTANPPTVEPKNTNDTHKNDFNLDRKAYLYDSWFPTGPIAVPKTVDVEIAPQPQPETVADNTSTEEQEATTQETSQSLPTEETPQTATPETAKRIKVPPPVVPETKNVRRKNTLEADNVARPSASSFGLEFPANPQRGDLFLRVDAMPNKLFKYTGTNWIEVDKEKTDSYYDEAYILFLIDKLRSGEYEIDQLSETLQEVVLKKLNEITYGNSN